MTVTKRKLIKILVNYLQETALVMASEKLNYGDSQWNKYYRNRHREWVRSRWFFQHN